MAEIEVFAPARADLAGGTLDLWPLYCFHPGSVTVNVALAVGVRLRLLVGGAPKGTILHLAPGQPARELQEHDRHRDLVAAVGFHFCREGGFAVDVSEQPPVCSGLGGSSTFAVALARACLVATGKRLQARVLVHELRDLEAGILQVPTGVQDYYPSARRTAGVSVRPGRRGGRADRCRHELAGGSGARLLLRDHARLGDGQLGRLPGAR
jgi:D-glycero-alpha-D-manno-heptose-7-phosphate kinase